MSASYLQALLFAFSLVAFSGCGGTLDDPDRFLDSAGASGDNLTPSEFGPCADAPPAFLSEAAQCGGCHTPGGVASFADFTSPGLADRLVDTLGQCPEEVLADPADPELSTMVRWMRGTIETCSSTAMPPFGDLNSDEDIACLAEWIDALDGTRDLPTDGEP
ncbi:MAG: cytochrome c [Myxococcota bacterium]